MHGGSGDLHTALQCLFMHMKSIVSHTTERGDQRRMNIDDTITVFMHHSLRDLHQEACQHDQIRGKFLHLCKQRIVKYFSALIILRRHTYRRNSCITCSLQALHRLVVADDTDDLRIGDLARCDSINDRLQIRSAAGYQYDYS